MGYAHTNSKGKEYFLNTKETVMNGGSISKIYYFSKDVRDTACDMPTGYKVAENSVTGLPVLKKEVK